jgi:hypothetical protein
MHDGASIDKDVERIRIKKWLDEIPSLRSQVILLRAAPVVMAEKVRAAARAFEFGRRTRHPETPLRNSTAGTGTHEEATKDLGQSKP